MAEQRQGSPLRDQGIGHIDRDDQTAKFWLAPVSLARNLGFSAAEIRRVERRVRENRRFLPEAME